MNIDELLAEKAHLRNEVDKQISLLIKTFIFLFLPLLGAMKATDY